MTKIQENSDLRVPFRLSNFIYGYSDNKMHFRNDPSRPLTYMAYWACWQIGDGAPYVFHVLSTIFHAATAALVAALTAEIALLFFGQLSWLAGTIAGLLFLTSPILAGTAVYVFGLSDVMSAALILGTILILFRAKTWKGIACGLAVFCLSLASKQSSVVAFPLLVAIDYFGVRFSKDRFRSIYLPMVGLIAAYLLMRWLYFGGIGDLEGRTQTFPLYIYAPLEGVMVWKYLIQTFLPRGLAIDHTPLPAIPLAAGYIGWAIVAVATLFALKAKSNAGKIVGLGWSFFLIGLLPVSSLLPTVDLYVERRDYLPAAGIFLAVGLVLWEMQRSQPKWKYGVAALFTMVLAAQSAVAWQRADLYGSVEGLWKEALTEDPQNPRALINLGVYYSAVGRWEEGRAVLDDLVKIQPGNGAVYTKLAYLYMQKSWVKYNPELAMEDFKKGLELDPTNIFAHFNVGVMHMERGEFAEAEESFMRAAKLSPQFTKAYIAAGQAAMANHEREKAAQYFKEALSIDPSLAIARQMLTKISN